VAEGPGEGGRHHLEDARGKQEGRRRYSGPLGKTICDRRLSSLRCALDRRDLDVGLWLQINKLTYTGMRFLLSGDFNQFTPLGNSFRGTQVAESAIEHAALMHTLCSGNAVTITEFRRSAAALFSFYASLIHGGSRFELPLADAVKLAKAQFCYASFARWSLVISHQRRVRLNRENNEQEAPPDAVRLVVWGKVAHGSGAQTMLIWPGVQLIGCVSAEKKGVRNGCLYTVASVGDDTVRLEGLEASFTFDQTKLWLRLSYAQTYGSWQGIEFSGSLRLWGVTHKIFSRRRLFVGLSRATDGAFIGLKDQSAGGKNSSVPCRRGRPRLSSSTSSSSMSVPGEVEKVYKGCGRRFLLIDFLKQAGGQDGL
jgi:hypothetical protein